jgi:diaminopimelate decarboxylase
MEDAVEQAKRRLCNGELAQMSVDLNPLPWWADNGVTKSASGLVLDGVSLAALAREHGTPLYVYRGSVVRRRLAEMRAALASTGLPARIYYAVKANRYRPLLELIRAERDIGIDACSPREVALALEMGFARDEISVTASMLSNRDFDQFAACGVHLNLDTRSALRRYGERVLPGTPVGLRLNPGIEVAYRRNPKLAYGNTKFGIYHEDFESALEAASAAGLTVDTLHVHCGWGMQTDAADAFECALKRLARFARQVPCLRVINVGGGLGARQQEKDEPLALESWSGAIRNCMGELECTIACEPGTFVMVHAGVLVVEVNTVEKKGETNWIGVDAGHNINILAAHYGIPFEVVHIGNPDAPPAHDYSLAGNINEGSDIFARQVALPEVQEGDLLGLLPAGAYGSSMSSDHCMRGFAREVFLG